MSRGGSPGRWERLSDARVGRLGTVRPTGAPHLVPVTFAVLGRRRVCTAVDAKPKRSTRLQRLANIEHEPRVSLLVDRYDEDWTRLWWVRADATARIVGEGHEFDEALESLAVKYTQYRDDRPEGPVIILAVDQLVGWDGG